MSIAPMKLPILPVEFWEARDIHKHIRDAAHSRLASADLVFHAALAKIAAMTSHKLTFNSGHGNRSSLNYFTAPVGISGIGKPAAPPSSTTTTYSPVPDCLLSKDDETEKFLDGLPLGSGKASPRPTWASRRRRSGRRKMGAPVTRKVRKQIRHNAFVVVDEGETFTRLGERNGANP